MSDVFSDNYHDDIEERRDTVDRVVYDHGGYQITLTNTYKFKVSGAIEDDNKSDREGFEYSSLQLAKEAIEKHQKLIDAQKRKDNKLDLSIINQNGVPGKITKIHAGTSDVIVKSLDGKSLETSRYDTYYPNVGWVPELVAEMAEAFAKAAALKNALRKFELKSSYGYGRMTDESYSRAIDRAQQGYDDVVAKIKEGRPDI